MKMHKETQKAIRQIPKELNRLSTIIAVIGKTLVNEKIEKLHFNEKKFRELVEKEHTRGGIT
ncbi:MAG TPA: hypothetical protein VFF13_03560 [archaeon]|nr:hypothetical protein [archaeon]